MQPQPQHMSDTWYVQVNGQAYGPYTAAQMQGFVTEGRVNAQSVISQSAAEGYAYAANFRPFQTWSGQQAQVLRPVAATTGGVLARQTTPDGYAPQAVAPNPAPTSHSGQTTVFMVMAEIRSGNGMQFLQALQAQGAAQRIGDSVWVLRSVNTVEQLRNTLSQCLTRDDRLFLLDSFANKTAWFNIGADMDARIRELWDIER